MRVHQLKILPGYFLSVRDGSKTFEIRRNDRKFACGDVLILQEWDDKKEEYTGRFEVRIATYITDFEQKPGNVVIGTKKEIDDQSERAKEQ